MKAHLYIFALLLLGALAVADTVLAAPQSRNLSRGILDCNNSSYGRIGSRTPLGDHVPVWDYAASLNTNILIYKECVLDVINTKFKQAAIARVTKNGIEAVLGVSGPEGPQFVTNVRAYFADRFDKRFEKLISGKETENICSPFKDKVKKALRDTYRKRMDRPYEAFSCSLSQGQLEACRSGDLEGCGGLAGMFRFVADPSNNALFAYLEARNYVEVALQEEKEVETLKLNWGRGFKSKTKPETITLSDGTTVTVDRIVTPGYLIAQYAADLMGSGLRQLENADEINEIIGVLLRNIGTEALSRTGGLASLSERIGGASYLDNLLDESYGGAEDAFVQTAIDSLNQAIIAQRSILENLNQVLDAIVQAKIQFRSNELACIDTMLLNLEKTLREELCIQSMGTTTGCAVTASRSYDVSQLEVFEGARGKIAIAGYARGNNSIKTYFRAGGRQEGDYTTTAGGLYHSFLSPAQDISELPDGTISPYAQERTDTTHTTLGQFRFSKTTIGEHALYNLPYDLPDVVVTAVSPTSSVPRLSRTLNLTKRYSQSAIEAATSPMRFEVVQQTYQYIAAVENLIAQLTQAKETLEQTKSKEAVAAAEALLASAQNDAQALIFSQEMAAKIAEITAMPQDALDNWQQENAWCGTEGSKNAWRQYVQ